MSEAVQSIESARVQRQLAAARRTEKLLAISAAVADAMTVQEVCEAIVDQLATVTSASSVGIWLLADPATATLAGARGYGDASAQTLGRLALGEHRMPITDALAGEAIWIASQAEMLVRYPAVAELATAGRTYEVACLPIRVHARVIGALGMTYDAPNATDDDDRAFLILVAGYAAQALERVRLFDAERASRQAAEAAMARTALLHSLAARVLAAETLEQVYDAALDTIERALGTPRSAVLLFDGAGIMQFVASRGLSDRYRTAVTGHSPWRPDSVGPEPIFVTDVAASPELAHYGLLFADEGIGALGFFPLITGGALIGKFMVYYPSPRTPTAEDLEMARGIANHVAGGVALLRSVHVTQMFTGMLGHDLRNPLAAIMTGVELALARGGPALAVPLRRVLASGERMTRMIDQVLDVTRVRAGGGITLARAPADLYVIARETRDEVALAHPDRNIQLATTGALRGHWDHDRLAQVFSNLIGNAVAHGSRAVPVRVELDGTDASSIRVIIRNAGTIPAELMPQLFEPFRGTRRTGHDGMGLGLYISRQIVRAHGGAITVASTDGETAFTIELPRG